MTFIAPYYSSTFEFVLPSYRSVIRLTLRISIYKSSFYIFFVNYFIDIYSFKRGGEIIYLEGESGVQILGTCT